MNHTSSVLSVLAIVLAFWTLFAGFLALSGLYASWDYIDPFAPMQTLYESFGYKDDEGDSGTGIVWTLTFLPPVSLLLALASVWYSHYRQYSYVPSVVALIFSLLAFIPLGIVAVRDFLVI